MKIAVVTGANRGLGAGFAEDLVARGYIVYAAMRSTDGYETSNPSILPVTLDITDDDSIRALKKRIESDGNKIDILINNAGTNAQSATGGHRELVNILEILDRSSLNEMFNTNATSALMTIKELHGLCAPNALIINISADRASYHDEFANSSANYGYRASKIALNMFSFVLPTDLRGDIRVVALHPGDIETDMNPGGYTKPIDAAQQIYKNIVTNWRPEFNGAFVRFNGELYPL
jgi:NAD(P)-dependent dehydrogenase (short-subunit alcohol dehydrogenase family)